MIEKYLILFLGILVFGKIDIRAQRLPTAQLGWRPNIFNNEECREERQPVVEYYHQNGMQYLFFSQRVTWEEANLLCQSYNSKLALLDTMEKALGVAKLIAQSNIVMEDTWLGGRRIDNIWHWIDKKTGPWEKEISMEIDVEDYPPWSRQPVRPTKECLAIDRRSHEHPNFIDLDCRLQRPFICEKRDDEEISSPIPSKWVQINRNTYILYHGRVTWQEAATFCRTQGARLAILKNPIVINILAKGMTKTRPDFESLWIGAHYSYGQWVWMATGSVLNSLTNESGYPPWRFGRPEKNDGCLLLDRHIENNSTFVETTCDRKRDFVCEEYSDDDEDDWLDEPVKFSHDNSTYIIYPIHKTWQESQDFCRERGSVLAHVDNINPINLIIEAMGDHPREISHVWLGGIYSKKIDQWKWIHNNKKITKQRDEFGYPPWAQIASEMESDTTDNSMCLNLDRSDHVKPHFYGLDCKSQQPFVCKITCEVPPPVDNGYWNCSDIVGGQQCILNCNENLIIMGMKNITCTYKNGWISGNDLTEFPVCLKTKEYTSRMIRSLSQDIQKSSGYYLIIDHSVNSMKSMALDLTERIVTAFPASYNMKIGLTTYVTTSPMHLSFNQTVKCSVINAVEYLKKNISQIPTKKINITQINHDISKYNGRRISIIAMLDSTRGSYYMDALLQFKSIGHHVIIIGTREDSELLLPAATIGYERRVNLFLFKDNELKEIINELKKHEKKNPQCLKNSTFNLEYISATDATSSQRYKPKITDKTSSTSETTTDTSSSKSDTESTSIKPSEATTESEYEDAQNDNSQETSSSSEPPTTTTSSSTTEPAGLRAYQDQTKKRESPESDDEK